MYCVNEFKEYVRWLKIVREEEFLFQMRSRDFECGRRDLRHDEVDPPGIKEIVMKITLRNQREAMDSIYINYGKAGYYEE